MSPGVRFFYFLLLVLSVLSLWFGGQDMLQAPLGNFSGLAAVGFGMLILIWVMANPLKPNNPADANSTRRWIMRWFDTLAQALFDRPLFVTGISLGVIAVGLTSKPAYQHRPILLVWAAGILLFVAGSATPGKNISIRTEISQAFEWVRKSKWELFAILAFLSRSISIDQIPYSVIQPDF